MISQTVKYKKVKILTKVLKMAKKKAILKRYMGGGLHLELNTLPFVKSMGNSLVFSSTVSFPEIFYFLSFSLSQGQVASLAQERDF